MGQNRFFNPATTQYALPRNVSILITDDNELNRRILKHSLLGLFNSTCQIDEAKNGQEAVDAFATKHYDVIFMDCEMPIKNGLEATKEIRDQSKRVMIISNSTHPDWCNTKFPGATNFIGKNPFNKEQIGAVLQTEFCKVQEKAGQNVREDRSTPTRRYAPVSA